ncbi:MAG: Crp/Fnr family transcriptional regulator [Bradymonadales bacterium]|nr:Crp/Fnr family transcriptional regulator [Bradymonadales bacterium]
MVKSTTTKEPIRKIECKAGATLFREDQPAEALFVVESGYLQVSRNVHSMPCQIESLSEGDVLGEHALFADQPYQSTAVAVEDTVCLRIPAGQFVEMLQKSPDLALRIMKKLASRLIHLQFRLANFTLRSPLARLMHQLLAEVETANTEREVPVPFDLPEVLALERAAVDDLIRRLIREGLISVDENGNFTIDDLDGFQRCLTYLELKDRFERLSLD